MNVEKIVATARGYIGQTETANNKAFTSPAFQKKLEAVGWITGQAWCAYTGELIWTEATDDIATKKLITKYFSASATATFKNFDLAPEFETGQVPKVGALVIWRHGAGWQGHLGVVVEVGADKIAFKAVEGNTNNAGGREGVVVALKPRKIKEPYKPIGLNLVGFVYPKV